MKTRLHSFSVFILFIMILIASCKKDESDGDINLTVTPNPVSAVYDGEMAKWDFSVTIANNTYQSITLGPIFDKLYDTDTQYTFQTVYYGPSDNWLSAGLKIPSGDSFSGNYYFKTTEAHSGKYDFTMTTTGEDGQDYVATLTIILQ